MMKIKFYQGNSNRSTQWHLTPEKRTPPKKKTNKKKTKKTKKTQKPKNTPKNQSYRLWWDAADQCVKSHDTYTAHKKFINTSTSAESVASFILEGRYLKNQTS